MVVALGAAACVVSNEQAPPAQPAAPAPVTDPAPVTAPTDTAATPPAPAPTAAEPAPTSTETVTGKAPLRRGKGDTSDGTYSSKSCGARKYERLVTLGPDRKVTVEDRVSPCPQGAQCIWSGIVMRSGTYGVIRPNAPGGPITFTLELGAPTPANAPVQGAGDVSKLEWYESRGQLTESGDNCPYEKVAPTTPSK